VRFLEEFHFSTSFWAARRLTGPLLAILAAGLLSALLWTLLWAAFAAAAFAGDFHVYSCRTPAGVVAPVDGWSPSEHPTYDPTLNTCASGGGLVAAVDAGYTHTPNSENDKATWAFEAPKGETITEATLWRAGEARGGGDRESSYLFWLAGGTFSEQSEKVFDECTAGEGCLSQGNLGNPLAPENRLGVPGPALNGRNLSLNAHCGAPLGKACPTGEPAKITYDAMVELFAADIVLSQPAAPTVSAVGGGLAEEPSVAGASDVAFHASDSPSGLYEAVFTVDGAVASRAVLSENSGRCRNVGGASTDSRPSSTPAPARLN
jgi:hypothetical protein